MAILEAAAGDSHVGATPADGLLERLLAIAELRDPNRRKKRLLHAHTGD